MNPWGLGAGELLLWGLVAHLVADWLLQSDWMAAHKSGRRVLDGERSRAFASGWWDRHPAAYVHAAIHMWALAAVFGLPAIALAGVHLLIDTRVPVAWLARRVGQTPPNPEPAPEYGRIDVSRPIEAGNVTAYVPVDIGMLVRIAVDQVWHVVSIAVAALVVGVAG